MIYLTGSLGFRRLSRTKISVDKPFPRERRPVSRNDKGGSEIAEFMVSIGTRVKVGVFLGE
jgi:hypothetical protein